MYWALMVGLGSKEGVVKAPLAKCQGNEKPAQLQPGEPTAKRNERRQNDCCIPTTKITPGNPWEPWTLGGYVCEADPQKIILGIGDGANDAMW